MSAYEEESDPHSKNVHIIQFNNSKASDATESNENPNNLKAYKTFHPVIKKQVSHYANNLPRSVSTMSISTLSPYSQQQPQKNHEVNKTKIWIGGKWYVHEKANLREAFSLKFTEMETESLKSNEEKDAKIIKAHKKIRHPSDDSNYIFVKKNTKLRDSKTSNECHISHSPIISYTFIDSHETHRVSSKYKGASVFNSTTCPLYQNVNSIPVLNKEKVWIGGKWYFNENTLKQVFHSKIKGMGETPFRSKTTIQCQTSGYTCDPNSRNIDNLQISNNNILYSKDHENITSLPAFHKSNSSLSTIITRFSEDKNLYVGTSDISSKEQDDKCTKTSQSKNCCFDSKHNLTKIWIGGKWYLQNQNSLEEAYPSEKTKYSRNEVNHNNQRIAMKHVGSEPNKTRRIFTSTPTYSTPIKSKNF